MRFIESYDEGQHIEIRKWLRSQDIDPDTFKTPADMAQFVEKAGLAALTLVIRAVQELKQIVKTVDGVLGVVILANEQGVKKIKLGKRFESAKQSASRPN